MKTRGVLASILFIVWFGMAPTTALGCCHHGNHCDDCNTYDGSCSDDCCQHGQGSGHCHWTASGAVADLQNARVAAVVSNDGTTASAIFARTHMRRNGGGDQSGGQ